MRKLLRQETCLRLILLLADNGCLEGKSQQATDVLIDTLLALVEAEIRVQRACWWEAFKEEAADVVEDSIAHYRRALFEAYADQVCVN